MGSSRSSTNASQETINEQLALQDFEGLGIAGVDGSVTVNQTADGAFDVASDAISAGYRTAELAEELNYRSLDFAADVVDGSNRLAGDALDFGGETLRDSYDFGGDVFSQSLNAITGLVDRVTTASQDTLAGTVGALQGITQEQNQSIEARNQALVKWVVLALIAFAGIQSLRKR